MEGACYAVAGFTGRDDCDSQCRARFSSVPFNSARWARLAEDDSAGATGGAAAATGVVARAGPVALDGSPAIIPRTTNTTKPAHTQKMAIFMARILALILKLPVWGMLGIVGGVLNDESDG
jgi:hypothetical protein